MSLAAAAVVARALTESGLPATDTLSGLHLPGVWVTPRTVEWQTLDRTTARVSLDLYLCCTPGADDHLDQLDSMLSHVHRQGYRFAAAETVSLTIPASTSPVPAVLINITVTTRETQ